MIIVKVLYQTFIAFVVLFTKKFDSYCVRKTEKKSRIFRFIIHSYRGATNRPAPSKYNIHEVLFCKEMLQSIYFISCKVATKVLKNVYLNAFLPKKF